MGSAYWIGWAAGSWGESWGDVLVEEHPEKYPGGGLRQFSDASDDDILRMVQDKWEAIERSQAEAGNPASEEKQQHAEQAPSTEASSSEHSGQAPNIPVPSIIAAHWPDLPPVPRLDDTAILVEAERQRKILEAARRSDDEALLLILAEL